MDSGAWRASVHGVAKVRHNLALVLQGLSAKELGLPPCYFGHAEVLQIFAPLCK